MYRFVEGAPISIVEWTASYLANLLNRDTDMIFDALTDPAFCPRPLVQKHALIAHQPLTPFHVNSEGYPVSSNPTWNACITGRVTLEDIRNNPDKDRKGVSRDCGYYRSEKSWRHPDLQIYFTWDRETKEIGLPEGYEIVAEKQLVTQK